MTALETIAKRGSKAVRELRLEKLRSGLPFMINAIDLEPNQFYYEFPGGDIQLASLEDGAQEFTMVRKLSADEEKALRSKYGFSRV
jgi:hypothetical protein